MTTAAEVFVVELARASRKANRIVRHLSRADREDIIGSALLWCWEHRENYSLTTTLETWFSNVVKNALRQWHRGELRNSAEELNEIPTGDSTLATVEAWEAATKLAAALPPEYRQVARFDARGYSRTEMVARGIPKDTVDATRARIKQLRRLLPDDHEYRRALRTASPPNSDDTSATPGTIDKEIEALEAMPQHGADCPVCWRCCWFYGLLPAARKSVRMGIQEPEVKAAVRDTEARKIDIARRIRAGTLGE